MAKSRKRKTPGQARHVSIFYYNTGEYTISITPINRKTKQLNQSGAKFYKPGEMSRTRLTLFTWFNNINVSIHLGIIPSAWFRFGK